MDDRVHIWRDSKVSGPDTTLLGRIMAAGPDGIRPSDLERTDDRPEGGVRDRQALRPTVGRLVEAGFVLERPDGRLLVPAEARVPLLAWARAQTPRVRDAALSRVLPDPAGPADITESVARLLGSFRHPIPLTRDGALYRRFHERLLAALGPDPLLGNPSALGSEPWWESLRRAYAWQGYRDRLAAFLALLTALGLLRVDPDRHAVLATADARTFLEGHPWHVFHRLALAWVRVLDGFTPGTGFFVQALPPDAWVSLRPILPEVTRRSSLRSELTSLVAWTGYHLGFLALAGGPEEGVCVRLTEAGAAALAPDDADTGPPAGFPDFEETALVQGSFEILTPPYLHPAAWYDLLLIADPVRIDRVSVLRLSETSFGRHADAGLTSAEAAGLVRRLARGNLPQAVAFTLDTWVLRMQGLTVETRAVVRLDDAGLGERVAGLLAKAGLPFEAVTETIWVVSREAHLWLQEEGPSQGLRIRGERVRAEDVRDFGDFTPNRSWFALPWPGPARPVARDLRACAQPFSEKP